MMFSIASKTFNGNRILEPTTLELVQGSITLIMGPSGSGKTTLLRLLAGLEQDDDGNTQCRFKIGMMFQEPHLLPWKTVIENIEIAGSENGILAALSLQDAARLYPRELSLGMARRVAFARAIVSQPEILILDEPFASLDTDLADTLRQNILRFSTSTGVPIVITSHNREDALALNTRLFMLNGKPAKLQPETLHDSK